MVGSQKTIKSSQNGPSTTLTPQNPLGWSIFVSYNVPRPNNPISLILRPILFLSTFSGWLRGLKPIPQPPDPWNDSLTPWNELAMRNYMGINDFIWKPPQKQNKKTAQKWAFWVVFGGFGFFLWGCHIKPALFRSFLAKIYHPQEKTTLKISIMMGTGW